MVDFRELTAYVESHPDDYEQRWRLSKKLYMACEYRGALTHLVVLKREWTRKLNVLRYLSATYYRLGRYDEAIGELRDAIELWPNELPLREQLARAFEMAGRRSDAVREWEGVLRIDPRHPMAARSIARLRREPSELPQDELGLAESDSGIDLGLGMVCPHCGARNSEDFERCWQCHTALLRPGTPTPTLVARKADGAEGRFWLIALGAGALVLLITAVYVTLRDFSTVNDQVDGFIVARTVDELLAHLWRQARYVTGAVLLAAWPVFAWFGAVCFCERHPSWRVTTLVGVVAALAAYLLSRLPIALLPVAPLVLVALTLILVLTAYPVPFGRALGAWFVQAGLGIFATVALFLSQTGTAPLREYGALTAYAAQMREQQPAGAVRAHTVASAPGSCRVKWQSTGSAWLDTRARLVRIEITRDSDAKPLTMEVTELGNTLRYDVINTYPHVFTHVAAPDRGLAFLFTGEDASAVQVTVTGILPAVFEP